MTVSKVIAFSAHDSVGKTTTAQALADLTDGIIVSFATPLKVAAANHLDIPVATIFEKPTPDYLRAYMRAFGWAMRQLHGENYWVLQWEKAADPYFYQGRTVIVDDLRHLSEFKFIDEIAGGHVVSLRREAAEPPTHTGDGMGNAIKIDYPPIISEVWDVRDAIQLHRKPFLDKNNPPKYRQMHDVIATDNWTPEDVAELIADIFNLKENA
jgi:hypothetical protein